MAASSTTESVPVEFSFRAGFLLSELSYEDWEFDLGADGCRPFLQVVFMAPCADSGELAEQRGRKWFLSTHMTDSEIVQTALCAVLTAEEHEVRERFLYRGRAIFGPHFHVDQLWHLAGQSDGLDPRRAP